MCECVYVCVCVWGGGREAVGFTARIACSPSASSVHASTYAHRLITDTTHRQTYTHREADTKREKIEERTSTSLDTAEVHSSRIANCGLCVR